MVTQRHGYKQGKELHDKKSEAKARIRAVAVPPSLRRPLNRIKHSPIVGLGEASLKERGKLFLRVKGSQHYLRLLQEHPHELDLLFKDLSAFTDITERKHMEEVLRMSEEHYRKLFISSRDAIMTLEPPLWRFTSGNPAAVDMFRAGDVNRFVSTTPWRLSPKFQPDGKPSIVATKAMLKKAMRHGNHFFEWQHKRLDGECFPASVLLSRVKLGWGRTFLQVTVRDITQSKRAEEVLRESEERFLQVTKAIEEVFWLADTSKNKMLYVSPGYERIWKRTCQSLYDAPRAWLDAIHPEDRQRVLDVAVTRQVSGKYDVKYRILRPDGSKRWIHDRVFPIKDAAGKVVRIAGVATDISERVKLEHEILEISERERRGIAQDLHDGLGQLLVGATYLTNSLRQDLAAKSLPEVQQLGRILKVLNEATAQARSLARGLHPVKHEHNGLMVALQELASRTEKLFRIRCHFNCRGKVLVGDTVIATNLFRIAQEAVTNAIKHGKAERIEIRLTETPDRTIVTVKNDGDGMPARSQKKVGLGLHIMQYRAGIIGGSLAIQKNTGRGIEVACSVARSNKIPKPISKD